MKNRKATVYGPRTTAKRTSQHLKFSLFANSKEVMTNFNGGSRTESVKVNILVLHTKSQMDIARGFIQTSLSKQRDEVLIVEIKDDKALNIDNWRK
ncbi:MAG: hypothetical protein IPG58_07935 [Acidobacteria bacterium]|nr:hypothetical protein [Acidobacteriota bacterium]